MSKALSILPLIVLVLACIHTCKCPDGHHHHHHHNIIIGECDEGHSCSECYQTLVKSLLSKDQNLFNLSKAFFPTNSDDRPQFVTITYRFKQSNETKTWYWSEKGSFFVYPLQTFEYLSLFFGKASAFFAGSVTVTLDQDCADAEEDFMQHLTQRIKLYTAKKSIRPEIDDSYIATAHNNESWMTELKARKNQIVTIAYCTPILAGVIFIAFIVVFVIILCCNYKQRLTTDDSTLFSNKIRSAIAALAVISLVNILYAFGLSCYACSAIKHQPEIIMKTAPLANVSVMVLVLDFVLLLLCIATDILAFLAAVFYSSDCAYIILGLTSLYSLLCILQHCPYIILAYINDAELTGSIFIFYTVSWGLIFLAIAVFYTYYHKLVFPCHYHKLVLPCHKHLCRRMILWHNSRRNTNTEADLESSTSSQGSERVNRHRKISYETLDGEVVHNPQKCRKLFCESFIFIMYCALLCILVMGAAALLSCYLVILPITNRLSHLFGRLVSTYQTALIILGTIVTYKAFFEKKNGHHNQSADLDAGSNASDEEEESRNNDERETNV